MTCDPAALRSAFGRFLTGVTVVTARDAAGRPVGFTANSFTSVSLEPPLLLVCPGNHLSGFDTFKTADRFGISILAEGQENVSNLFASGKGDRFAACEWDMPAGDVPLISGRAAGFVCATASVTEAGDHVVLMGQVNHFDDAGLPGLGFGPDGYFSSSKERLAEAPARTNTRASVLLEYGGTLFLEKNGDLPTVEVTESTSPLRALEEYLRVHDIRGDVGVVYAIYDDGPGARRIVFRGHLAVEPKGLRAHSIADFEAKCAPDPAVGALLRRFKAEHRAQSFGLYWGTEKAGDVLPASRGI